MDNCSVCGNRYDKAFQVTTHEGETFTFDSIECAAHHIAPVCAHCNCKILGHGVETDTHMYCCASCARHEGEHELTDRA